MCGRYSLYATQEEITNTFGIDEWEDLQWSQRFNIAPSQDVWAVVESAGRRRAGTLRWGLVPSWAKDPKIGYKMINARAETVSEKPSFKKLLVRRRCVIIADGFYEWKKNGKEKQPYRFQLKTKQPFAFAGLWDRWQNGGNILHTCTIITTEANEVVQDIHDRMPVILTKDAADQWLDQANIDKKPLLNLLSPYPATEMESYPVSTLVNSPKYDSSDILNSI